LKLSPEQQIAVDFREGPAKVLAGPGSGKTTVLATRYGLMVGEGISPNDILSLSFTTAAAKTLQSRVEKLTGTLSSKRTGSGSRTFHSLALAFAQEERNEFPYRLAEFPLATEPVAYRIASESGRRFNIDARRLRPVISLWKRGVFSPAQAIRMAEQSGNTSKINEALAYKEYDRRSKEAGVLDFDGLIQEMVVLLRKPEVRSRWIFDWLQLDEAQDMSISEWNLAKLLSGKSVIAVGDTSQGIYGFRGSEPKLFVNMDDLFPGTTTLYLGCNYRSTPEVIDFIKPHAYDASLANKFWTPNASGPAPQIKGFQSPREEAIWVLSKIKESQ
jgi:DNA helicase-2/ATP-dependent DNA helicase PcrA